MMDTNGMIYNVNAFPAENSGAEMAMSGMRLLVLARKNIVVELKSVERVNTGMMSSVDALDIDILLVLEINLYIFNSIITLLYYKFSTLSNN